MRCPLCGCPDLKPSGFGSIVFENHTYLYQECWRCGSAACDPMPDEAVLARMYGPTYGDCADVDVEDGDPRSPAEVVARLRGLPPGRFIDFGCGPGALLVQARDLGWAATGLELHPDVARRASAHSQCQVFTRVDELRSSSAVPADVIHLGDVLEHLPAPVAVLRTLLGVLRPTGRLMAQGPLEAGPCLFSAAIRASRRLRPAHPLEMPPYHVLQATVMGQRALFDRAGLDLVEFRVAEVAWPAPARLTTAVLRKKRSLGLYLLRRVSQAASALAPARWGNRYFYVGTPRDSSAGILTGD